MVQTKQGNRNPPALGRVAGRTPEEGWNLIPGAPGVVVDVATVDADVKLRAACGLVATTAKKCLGSYCDLAAHRPHRQLLQWPETGWSHQPTLVVLVRAHAVPIHWHHVTILWTYLADERTARDHRGLQPESGRALEHRRRHHWRQTG
jgi:hypothetical protein